MIRYPALIDGDNGAFGVVFPDIPGVGAMGHTVDEALLNAEDALRDYAIEAEKDGEELAEPSPFQTIETPTWESTYVHPPYTHIGQERSSGADSG